MKAEAQFPTPINATFTLGICGTLLGLSICEWIIKSYAVIFRLVAQRQSQISSKEGAEKQFFFFLSFDLWSQFINSTAANARCFVSRITTVGGSTVCCSSQEQKQEGWWQHRVLLLLTLKEEALKIHTSSSAYAAISGIAIRFQKQLDNKPLLSSFRKKQRCYLLKQNLIVTLFAAFNKKRLLNDAD